jgi:hypothetical protein
MEINDRYQRMLSVILVKSDASAPTKWDIGGMSYFEDGGDDERTKELPEEY